MTNGPAPEDRIHPGRGVSPLNHAHTGRNLAIMKWLNRDLVTVLAAIVLAAPFGFLIAGTLDRTTDADTAALIMCLWIVILLLALREAQRS